MAEVHQGSITMRAEGTLACKVCGSGAVVRYGRTAKGHQRLLCRSCGHSFLANSGLPGMRYAPVVIAAALNQVYQGLSLRRTQRFLGMIFRVTPHYSCTLRWITRYAAQVEGWAESLGVPTGPTWIALRSKLRVPQTSLMRRGSAGWWIWDVFDGKSCYLLASHLSHRRTPEDAEAVLSKAATLAVTPPGSLVTDGSAAYSEALERVFGSEVVHVQAAAQPRPGLTQGEMEIKTFAQMVSERRKVMRLLRSTAAIEHVLRGWRVHYNLVRPHPALQGRTPGEVVSGLKISRGWLELVSLPPETWGRAAHASLVPLVPSSGDQPSKGVAFP